MAAQSISKLRSQLSGIVKLCIGPGIGPGIGPFLSLVPAPSLRCKSCKGLQVARMAIRRQR